MGYTARDLFKAKLIPVGPALSKPKNIVSVTVNFKDSELLVEVARNLLAASQNQKQFPYKRLL